MNQFTKDIMQALVKKEDISEVFRKHLETAVNTIPKTELAAFLDYEKYDRIGFNLGNSRNGSYTRTLRTEYGELELSVPRDRNDEFNQQTVAPYKRSNDTLESFVNHMFQKGLAMSEISDLIEKMYDHHYTPQTIPNMTKAMSEQVEAFKVRPLDARYACVYLDATYISIKRDTVSKEAYYSWHPGGRFERRAGLYSSAHKICIRLGRSPIGLERAWCRRAAAVYLRRLERYHRSDFAAFPDANYQACCGHLSRGIAQKVRVTDCMEILDVFKSVYRVESRELGEKALKAFVDKWKTTYPKVTKSLEANPYNFTFYDFPKFIC